MSEKVERKKPKYQVVDKMKNLIAKGKRRGYITYEEFNDAQPEGRFSSNQIAVVLTAFDEFDIKVVNGSKIRPYNPEIDGSL